MENKQKEVPRFFYIYTNGAFGAHSPQIIYTMKHKFILICALLCSLQIWAAIPSLVVKPLNGSECITALGDIGKVVYSDDSLYVYNVAKELVFSNLLSNVQHIRFSGEQPNAPTNVENTQSNSDMQVKVYPNPTQDILMVENAQGDVLRLYTMDGRLVVTQAVENGSAQVNVAELPTGNYLLLCANQSFQVIKQ